MRSIHVVRPLESISTEDELFMKRLLIQHNYNGFSAYYTLCFNITVFLYFFPLCTMSCLYYTFAKCKKSNTIINLKKRIRLATFIFICVL